MAKDATAPASSDVQWSDVRVGLGGEEWDFDTGPLVGHYLGSSAMDLPDTNNPGQKREQSVHRFADVNDPDVVHVLWGSYQLDRALSDDAVSIGGLLRVTFQGTRQFKDSETGQPRTVKNYRVQVAAQ